MPARVREARLEAGLSLAQVAAGELSRTAVHLIETGAMRPSMRSLQVIARRTHRPVEHFLTAPPATEVVTADQLHELEAMYDRSQHRRLIEAATDLMPADDAVTWVAAYLRFLIGRSLVRLGSPEQALVELGRAQSAFETYRDHWSTVECLDWTGGALHLQEDPSALSVVRRALRHCRQLDPMPAELEARILCHVAAIHVARHEWEAAVEAYAAASRASGRLRDLRRTAQVHDGLSLAYEQLGAPAKALLHSRRALALRALDRDLSVVARTENNLGLLLLRQGRVGEARAHLERSLDRCIELGLDRGRAHVLLSLAELEEAGGRLDEARARAEEASGLAANLGERMTEAAAHVQLGSIAAAQGRASEADTHFQVAIDRLRGLGVRQRLLECHRTYGAILEQRADLTGALAQWKAAATLVTADDHQEMAQIID